MPIFENEPAELPVAVLDMLPNPVLIKGPDLRYVWVNKAFERLFGVSRTDLYGRLDQELFKDRQVAQCNGGDLRVLETGEVDEAYETVFDDRSSARETITRKKRLTLSDGSIYLVGVMHDITEVVHINRALEEKQGLLADACVRAEEANNAKSRFLAGMSHELRTPLNAILGFAEILSGCIGPVKPEKSMEYGNIILESGGRLLRLINEVLDLSRVEAGHMEISNSTFDPAKIARQVTAELTHLARSHAVSLIDETTENSDGIIYADPDRAFQALLNLVGNAIKYNRPGGTVKIATTCTDEYVRFSVTDSGLGIAKNKHSQVFETFNRLGNEGSAIEGTGIGLCITKEYIEKMSGRIGFESTVGKGSTFWFDLPTAHRPTCSMNEFLQAEAV